MFERYDIDVPARIELITSRGRRKMIESHVVDLSAVGGLFSDVKSLPLAQLLQVNIFFPFKRPNSSPKEHELITMTVTGQVVRSGLSGTAISFTGEYRLTSRTICKGTKETKNRPSRMRKDETHTGWGNRMFQSNTQPAAAL